jgi:hypothetical protein
MSSRLRTAGLVAFLVTFAVVAVLQGTPTHAESPRTVGPIVSHDTFSRQDDASSIGPMWRAVTGTWGVEDGKAYVARRATDDNVAVLDPAVRGSTASVTVSGELDGAGLVFRYRDESNYWALSAAPRGVRPDGVWQVVKVIDGRPEIVGQFGKATPGAPARINVESSGDDLYVWGGALLHESPPKHFRDGALSAAPAAGLFLGSGASGDARFENFTVTR